MNYIYGPVKSRRLGGSLGINIVPFKYCTLDCIYCQLKRTSKPVTQRNEYVNHREVLSEIEKFLKDYPDYKKIDYITISGSGEPLLNSKVSDIIKGIKSLTKIPVALITNSTLLIDERVRSEILDLDLIVPSLDAFTQEVFLKIDRPFIDIGIGSIVDALISFRKEFTGKIWLEIMLVKGINDDIEYITQFKRIVDRIAPDRIHLNIPVRPPSESWVKLPALDRLKRIQDVMGSNCDLI